MRRLAPNADPILLPIAGLLNGIGYVFIARLDEDLAGLQATWALFGVAGFTATLLFVRRTRILEQYRYTLMFIGLGLLVLPLMPVIGREINGARIWVSFGPINFQPGEFAKIALAIFFAAYLVDKRELLALSSRRFLGMCCSQAWRGEPRADDQQKQPPCQEAAGGLAAADVHILDAQVSTASSI